MKTFAAVLVAVMAAADAGHSQNVNWRALREDQQNIVQFNAGYDFGATAQLSYGRSFAIFRPVILGIDYSLPMGGDLLDDFKIRLGGQMEIVESDGFSATIKIASLFRRHETALVRVVSFGADFAVVTGYYRPTWSVAGEVGFDKSVTSHLKHSDIMRTLYPAIKDGWYLPSGGHYYYGVQAGKSIGESFDLTLRLGATRAQDRDENAVIPWYVQLGSGLRF